MLGVKTKFNFIYWSNKNIDDNRNENKMQPENNLLNKNESSYIKQSRNLKVMEQI